MGVGASKNIKNVNWKIVKNMFLAWIITFPACGVLGYLMTLNVSLFVFNFIPIPPLDGSRIFMYFLPDKIYYKVMQYEVFGSVLVMLLLYTGGLRKIITKIVYFILNIFYYFIKDVNI